MFNRELMGNLSFSLWILVSILNLLIICSYLLVIWALLFKVPKKFKKMSLFKVMNKEFIASLEEAERKDFIKVRNYLKFAIFITLFKFIIGFIFKLLNYFGYF